MRERDQPGLPNRAGDRVLEKGPRRGQPGVPPEASAQAFTVKGLTEANLWRWREAESSFLTAFALGFGKRDAWAADSALAGLGRIL